MKIGCQTIIFGRNLDNLDWVLANIANLGYTGVEFYQSPDRIWLYDHQLAGFRRATIEDIVLRLRRYSLAFLGMASGTLKERLAFCTRFDAAVREANGITDAECMPVYQYIEDFDDEAAAAALSHGVKLGFHPHAFGRYERFDQAEAEFAAFGANLYWLPDTAHMMVVGEDPVEVLSRLQPDKIIAVHLKAYNPAYGRAYHRYARGFVPLSDGAWTIRRCIETLEASGYANWYVVEQDYSHTDPVTSLAKSAHWLKDRGYMHAPAVQHDTVAVGPVHRPRRIPEQLAPGMMGFATKVYRAGDAAMDVCYSGIARSICRLIGAEYVSLWLWNHAKLDVRLVAGYPPELHANGVAGKVEIDSPALGSVRNAMDTEELEIAPLSGMDVPISTTLAAQQTGAKYAFTIALPNVYNPHSIRLLVCGATINKSPFAYADLAELIAEDVCRAANTALDNACSVAAASVNLAADDHAESAGFLRSIADNVMHHVNCEAVSIFLESRGGERLEARYAEHLKWRDDLAVADRCYRAADLLHPTVQCWKECRMVLTDSGPVLGTGGTTEVAKSREVVPPGSENHDDVLLVPLVAVNKHPDGPAVARAIGVVRCRNKRLVECMPNGSRRPYFTDDDAAIVSAICQAAVPHIDTLLRDEGVTANIAGMTHELNMPVNTLQAAVDRLQTLVKRNDTAKVVDLAEDMISWTGLMGKIIGMVDLFGKRSRPIEPECERIGLFGDVIAPLKPVMKKLLDNRRFSVDNIHYAAFESLPLLYLDRNLFQMVFFNLFSNAIKYAFDDPGQFEVDIDARVVPGGFRIDFSDYGPGISETFAESAFEHGMRGPAALNKIVKGMGLGLWVVKRVVEAHEGRVEISSFHGPTTISIYLPEARRSSAPPKVKKGI